MAKPNLMEIAENKNVPDTTIVQGLRDDFVAMRKATRDPENVFEQKLKGGRTNPPV